jgi:dTMP kinase
MSEINKTIPGGLVAIFEGIDGVGKTTQLRLAHTDLEARGYNVHATRNLGGSAIGERLRSIMLDPTDRPPAVNLYLSAAIQEALAIEIDKERGKGSIVLIDRGPMSLVAYQSYSEKMTEQEGWHFGDSGIKMFKPEQIILYNMDIESALGRARARNQTAKTDYYESQPMSYFKGALDILLHGAEKYGAATIDANQAIDVIHNQTMALINQAIDDKLKV